MPFTCLVRNLIENKYVGKIHYFKFPQTFSKSPKRKKIFIFKKNQFTFMPFKPNYYITYLSHSITFSVYFPLSLWNLQNHFVNKINVFFLSRLPFHGCFFHINVFFSFSFISLCALLSVSLLNHKVFYTLLQTSSIMYIKI